MMRTLLGSAALFVTTVALLAASGATAWLEAQEGQRLSSREVPRQIEEYCEADTDEARRAEIVRNLAATGDNRTRNALRNALRDDAQRPMVKKLIGELRHDSCWELLGGYVTPQADPEAREAALETIYLVRDERSIRGLIDLWSDRQQSNAAFIDEIAEGLRYQGLSLDQVGHVLRFVGDSQRGESARKILAPHFFLAPSESAETFEQRWEEIRDGYEQEARRFRMQGHDLLSHGTFHGTRTEAAGLLEPDHVMEAAPWLPAADFVIRRDANYLMESRQRFENTDLASFNRAAFTVTMRFMPLSDEVDSFNLGINSERDMFDCEVVDGTARIGVRRLRGSITALVNIGEWNELTYTVTFSGETRRIWVQMNGRPFEFNDEPVTQRRGQVNLRGGLASIVFRAPQNGQVVIGGFDLQVTNPNAGPDPEDADEADGDDEEDWRDQADRWRDRAERERRRRGDRR